MIQKTKALLLTLALSPLISYGACQIEVKDAYVLGGVPGQKNTAGYAHIKNTGNEACHLKAAKSTISERIELHTIEHKGDMMKMVQVDQFTIPANSEFSLAVGGNHLMFMNLKKDQELKPGTTVVPVELVFDNNQIEKVDFKVRDMKDKLKMH